MDVMSGLGGAFVTDWVKDWHGPETIVISAFFKNGRFCACGCYVITVMHDCPIIAGMENSNVAIIYYQQGFL